MNRSYVQSAAILGLLAVLLGAFGAHGLKALVDEKTLHAFNTGVKYQFFHIPLILFLAFAQEKLCPTWSKRSFICAIVGTILFSGSLYLLTLKAITGIGFLAIFGPVTPIGGLFLMLAWLFLFISVKSLKN